MAQLLQTIRSKTKMGFDQYHEPPQELSNETRTLQG